MNLGRTALGALALAVTIAAAPSAEPSDPAALARMRGEPVTGMTFVPLRGTPRPLARPGRPTVVIAFASWCEACMHEMPRTLAEYRKYAGRVDFVGIDYAEPPSQARALIAHFGIPFPVESYVPGGAPKKRRTIVVPSTLSEQQILALKDRLPDADYRRVIDAYRAKTTMTAQQFAAYAAWQGVSFETPARIASERAAEEAARQRTVLGLPHTFVIDRNGVVTDVLEGYTPGNDRVAAALAKLGVR